MGIENTYADKLPLQIKMSSQLTSLVPVLNGTNYQQWSAAMQSFPMSQGQWRCTRDGAEAPNTTTTTTEQEGGPSITVTTGREEVASWKEDAEKALGNIRLCLHHTIGYQFNDVESPSTLWETLKAKYGPVSLTHAFVEFKATTTIKHWACQTFTNPMDRRRFGGLCECREWEEN